MYTWVQTGDKEWGILKGCFQRGKKKEINRMNTLIRVWNWFILVIYFDLPSCNNVNSENWHKNNIIGEEENEKLMCVSLEKKI